MGLLSSFAHFFGGIPGLLSGIPSTIGADVGALAHPFDGPHLLDAPKQTVGTPGGWSMGAQAPPLPAIDMSQPDPLTAPGMPGYSTVKPQFVPIAGIAGLNQRPGGF